MRAKVVVTKETKQALKDALQQITGIKGKYTGTPGMSFIYGDFILDKHCYLNWSDGNPKAEQVIEYLAEKGFELLFEEIMEQVDNKPVTGPEEAVDAINISLPRTALSDSDIEKINRIIEAKGELLKAALRTDSLELIITDDIVTFPWFRGDSTPEEIQAYTKLITAIAEMVRTQKRVTSRPADIVNAKYEFRCFLLRLGFIGDEYKEVRKELLKNLSGSAAFKSGQKGVQE